VATVTALADRACSVTGLQTTGTERALIVAALNDCYQRAISESGAYRGSSTESLTAGTGDYDIATTFAITDLLEIKHVTASGGGLTNTRMIRVPESELLEMRENTTTTGASSYYALAGDTSFMVFPTPGASQTVTIYYVKAPPTLVESGAGAGEETTPSKIPARFHWDVLLAGSVVQALSKDQRAEDMAFWQARYEGGLASYLEYVNRVGGDPSLVVDSVGRAPRYGFDGNGSGLF